ncbi:DUF6461 domain-containing protein [Amycolatopsis sp. CA-230715]|uniref:DUF6461 domain-containing protein n=1 Tax=Amycolatopsis sp. CA-230715 TaxID=2745196 RepID=UPI001C0155A5|nr:DUF6461 domain-containing protein [Amycolatopsis sp. CA-230715]QWF78224.1 hypothetical protein HUW46_01619 [Amycolatopsis sp. CA-230715]
MTGDEYGWLSSSALSEAACVTMVKTTDLDCVLRGFGGVLDDARTIPFGESWETFNERYAVAVCRKGEYVVAVEGNGFQGSRPEVLRRVSALGETVSAFWNVNALTRFSYAVGGRVKTSFEVGVDATPEGEDPGCLAGLADAIDWAPGNWKTGMLRLAAEVTGLRFAEEWLGDEYTVAPIAAHLSDVHPIMPGFHQLEFDSPVLARALRRADDETLLAVARTAVDALTESVTLPELPHGDAELDELIRMANYEADAGAYAGYAPRTNAHLLFALDAVRTLRAAPNALTAAFKTVETAKRVKRMAGDDPAPMLADFLAVLGNPPLPSGSDGSRATGGTPSERHAWITGHWLGAGALVTYAHGVPIDSAAEAFGGTPIGTGPLSLSDTQQVALRRDGDWVLAIGFTRPSFSFQVLDALRPHGTVLVVGWSSSSGGFAYYAEPGHDVVLLVPGQGDVPEQLRAFTAALPEPSPEETAAWLLALGEVVSGVAMTPESLDAEHTLLAIDRKM